MWEKIVGETFKQYGLLGLIILALLAIIGYIIWDRYQDAKNDAKRIQEEKEKPENTELERLSGDFKELEGKLQAHLVKEAEEDIVIAEIKSEQKHLREKYEDLKETFNKLEVNQTEAFKLIG